SDGAPHTRKGLLIHLEACDLGLVPNGVQNLQKIADDLLAIANARTNKSTSLGVDGIATILYVIPGVLSPSLNVEVSGDFNLPGNIQRFMIRTNRFITPPRLIQGPR